MRRAQGGCGDAAAAGSVTALVGLALGAAALEVATMLPYLAAIGLVTSSGIGWPGNAGCWPATAS
ncbi:hypothetical protein NKG05_10315 [Oerskovia sp. M15]